MPRKKTAKRKTAEQIAAELLARRVQDFAAVGLAPEAAALPALAEVEVARAGEIRPSEKGLENAKRVDADQARRLDAFEALRPSMSQVTRDEHGRTHRPFLGAYDAARRLELIIVTSQGLHDRGLTLDRVDGSQGGGCRIDAVIDAADVAKDIKARISDRDAMLLWELIAPSRPWNTWRDAAAYVTGESNWNAQGAAVRAACVNLRDAWKVHDVEYRHRRARRVAA